MAVAQDGSQPRRLGRPPATDSALTRQRILDTAQRHFAHHGYTDASNNQIADESGVTTGAIYYYFRSKRELYTAVSDYSWATVLDEFATAIVGKDRLADRLQGILDVSVDMKKRYPHLAAFVISARTDARRHSELTECVGQWTDNLRAFYLEIFEQAAEDGDLAPDIRADDAANMWGAVMRGMSSYSLLVPAQDHAAAMAALKRLMSCAFFADDMRKPATRRRTTKAAARR
jgi:AcrR family transcriptional regulator